MSAIPELLGLSISEGVAFALGLAMGPALEPLTQEIKNESWSTVVNRSNGDISKPLEVGDLAAIVAESVEALNWGRTEARKTGIRQEDFDALFHAEQDAPGFGTLLQLLRRGLIDATDFEHGLRKAKLEGRWDTGLEALREVLLSPADLAMMRQQGFIAPDRQHSESALQGLNAERADLLFETSGLPPGIETALEMLRRSIVDAPTFAQIVREGHTKTKYTDELLRLKDRVLSATEYAELHLREWITEKEMNDGGALTGYSPDEMHLLYLNRGRPATGHQILIGLRRGGKVGGSLAGIPQDFVDAVARSNIRPEYTNPLWYGATTYPSGFMIRGAAQAGDITPAQAKTLLFESGWSEKWIDVFVESWTKPGASKADPHVTKAQNSLWTTMVNSYTAQESDEAALQPGFDLLAVPAGARTQILAALDARRALIRKQLTPAQIKKGFDKAAVNDATGLPWTHDDALAALLERGYSGEQARSYLNLPAAK